MKMKLRSFILMLTAFLCVSTALLAQQITEDKIPIPVQRTFFIKFPQAKDKKWETKDMAVYKVSFNDNNALRSASFNKEGNWFQTESEIEVSMIPEVVSKTVTAHLPEYKVKSANIIDTFYDGELYELVLTKDKVYKEIKLKPNGQIVSKSLDMPVKD